MSACPFSAANPYQRTASACSCEPPAPKSPLRVCAARPHGFARRLPATSAMSRHRPLARPHSRTYARDRTLGRQGLARRPTGTSAPLSASLVTTPWPSAYIAPRLYCASAWPCSAAGRTAVSFLDSFQRSLARRNHASKVATLQDDEFRDAHGLDDRWSAPNAPNSRVLRTSVTESSPNRPGFAGKLIP